MFSFFGSSPDVMLTKEFGSTIINVTKKLESHQKVQEVQLRSGDYKEINLSDNEIIKGAGRYHADSENPEEITRVFATAIRSNKKRIEIVASVESLVLYGDLPEEISELHIINLKGDVYIRNAELFYNRCVCMRARSLIFRESHLFPSQNGILTVDTRRQGKHQRFDGIYQLSKFIQLPIHAQLPGDSKKIHITGYLSAPLMVSSGDNLKLDGILDCTQQQSNGKPGELDFHHSWPLEIEKKALIATRCFRLGRNHDVIAVIDNKGPAFADAFYFRYPDRPDDEFFKMPTPLLYLSATQKIQVPNPSDENLSKRVITSDADGVYTINMENIPKEGEVIYFFSHFDWILYNRLFKGETLSAVAAMVRARGDQLYLIARNHTIRLTGCTPGVIRLLRLENPNGDIFVDDARLIDRKKVLLRAKNLEVKKIKHLPASKRNKSPVLILDGIYHITEQALFPYGGYRLIVYGHMSVVCFKVNATSFYLKGSMIVKASSNTENPAGSIEAPVLKEFRISKSGKLCFHEFTEFNINPSAVQFNNGVCFFDGIARKVYDYYTEKHTAKTSKSKPIPEPKKKKELAILQKLRPSEPTIYEKVNFDDFSKKAQLMSYTDDGIPFINLSFLKMNNESILCFIDGKAVGKEIIPTAVAVRIGDQLRLISRVGVLNLIGSLDDAVNEFWVSNPGGAIYVNDYAVLHNKRVFLSANKLIYAQKDDAQKNELIIDGYYRVDESIHFCKGDYSLLIKGFLDTAVCHMEALKVFVEGKIVAYEAFKKTKASEVASDQLHIKPSGILFSSNVSVETDKFIMGGMFYADDADIKAPYAAEITGIINDEELPGRSLSISSESQTFKPRELKESKEKSDIVVAKIYLRDAEISIFIQSVLSGIECHIQGREVKFELHSRMNFLLLECQAKLVHCLGEIEAQYEVKFNTDKLITHPDSSIAFPESVLKDKDTHKKMLERIIFRGNTWYNASSCVAARYIDVKANYAFTHGYRPCSQKEKASSQASERTFTPSATLKAHYLSVTASLFLKLGSVESDNTINVVSLINLGLGIVHERNYTSNSLIDVDCSIHVPYFSNIEEIRSILQDVTSFTLDRLHRFLEEDFLRYLSRMVSLLLPNARIPIALGLSLITLLIRIPAIYNAYRELSKQKTPIQIYQLLGPIVGAKDMIVLGSQIYTMNQQFELEFSTEALKKLIEKSDFSIFGSATGMVSLGTELLLPVRTSTAVLKLEAGLALTANTYSKTLWHANIAHASAAVNQAAQSLWGADLWAATAAVDFQFIGDSLRENRVARFIGKQVVSVHKYQQDGYTVLGTTQMTAEKGSHSGTFKILQGGVMAVKDLTTDADASLDNTAIKTERLKTAAGSKTRVKEGYLEYERLQPDGELELTDSVINSDELDPDKFLSHQDEFEHVTVKGSVGLKTKRDTRFTTDHQLDHGVHVRAPDIEVDSQMKTTQGSIALLAEERQLTLTERGDIKTPEGGYLKGKTGVTIKGKAELAKEGIIQSTEGGVKFVGEAAEVQAKDLYLDAEGSITRHEGATVRGRNFLGARTQKGNIEIGASGDAVDYRPGVFEGGAGEGHGGVGILLEAPNGGFINRAAVANTGESGGHAVFSGKYLKDESLIHQERKHEVHEYRSPGHYERHERRWTETTVRKAQFGSNSEQGHVFLDVETAKVTGDIRGKCQVQVRAKDGITVSAEYKGNIIDPTVLRNDELRPTIGGAETFVQADGSQGVNLEGGRITGTKWTSIKSKNGGLKIHSTTYTVPGRNGEPVNVYLRGQVIGGSDGAWIELPEGTLSLRGSDLMAKGPVFGRVKYLDGVPETHEFIVDQGQSSSWFGLHKTQWLETDTHVERNRIVSGNDKVDIKASKKARLVATDVYTPDSSSRIAGGDEGTEILDVITQRRRSEYDGWFGGLISRDTVRSTEDSHGVVAVSRKDITFGSKEGPTLSRGTITYSSEGNVVYKGNKIVIGESVLNTYFFETKRGFFITASVPGASYDSRHGFSTGIHDPLMVSLYRLQSSDGGEIVNLPDVGLKIVDIVKQAEAAQMRSGNSVKNFLEDRYLGGDTPGVLVRVGVGYGVERTRVHSQRPSNGRSVSVGFRLDGKEATIKGTPVETETVELNVEYFTQEAIPLAYSSTYESKSIEVGVNLAGQVDGNVAVNKAQTQGTTYHTQWLRFTKVMDVNGVQRWVLDGAVTEGEKIIGQVKEIESRSRLDTSSTSSVSASVGSSGGFSYAGSSGHEASIGERSGLRIRDKSDFTVQRHQEIHPAEQSTRREIGFFANVRDLAALLPTSHDPDQVPVVEAIPVSDAEKSQAESSAPNDETAIVVLPVDGASPGRNRWSMFADDKSFSDYGPNLTPICHRIMMVGCTPELVYSGLERRPAPGGDWKPVQNGQVTNLLIGSVQHFVDPKEKTVYNVTLENHLLRGVVKRRVVVKNGGWVYIETEKRGKTTFFNVVAKPLAQPLWGYTDSEIQQWVHQERMKKFTPKQLRK